MQALLLTSVAMLAFAANSLLCRLALLADDGIARIDAASFTGIRLLSGALTLLLLLFVFGKPLRWSRPQPLAALMLFIYAACFSFSYINLSAGTGALILFGSVQLSMIGYGLLRGERPGRVTWFGIVMAMVGLVYLLLPGVSAPPLFSALLMLVAGIAWGGYSLLGRTQTQPLFTTAWNFVYTIPFAVILSVASYAQMRLSVSGVLLAVTSGALASGVGYAIWYRALQYLSATRAATVQLTVPVIAALGGTIFLAEVMSYQMLIAGAAVLGGVYLTIVQRA